MTNKVFAQRLKDRSFIEVSGEERFDFLQGLITQDINKIKETGLIYSWLLTPQGKYAYDFFIFTKGESLFIDCESGKSSALYKRLKLYKLRSKVSLSLYEEPIHVFAVWTEDMMHDKENIYQDPRHNGMGQRLYCFGSDEDPLVMFEPTSYQGKRYQLGIGEGSEEIIENKSTLLEYRMDALNAVDFDKGCYMGQELTARMHYRGLLKKSIVSFCIEGQRSLEGETVTCDDKNVGDVRAFDCDSGYGLALVKKEYLEGSFDLLIAGKKIKLSSFSK